MFFDEQMNLQPISGSLSLGGLSPDVFGNISVATGPAIEPGYLLVYVDNRSIGKDVWFDNVQVLHYNTQVLEENHYYPFGLTTSVNAMGATAQPLKYQSKELEKSFGIEMYDFSARMQDPQLGRTWQPDPMSVMRTWTSPYSWVQNNPVGRIDPTGAIDEPVYTSTGDYRGDTKEGFKGDLLIYDGNVDFTSMTKDELIKSTKNDKQKATTYDRNRKNMTGDAKTKIMSHVLSELEGTMINGEGFSMKRLYGGKIQWGQTYINQGKKSNFITAQSDGLPEIIFLDNHSYESTVENLQATLLVHEWFTHGIDKKGDFNFQHYKAYQNVIMHPLWLKTTDRFKAINVESLEFRYRTETKRALEGNWLEIYKAYINCK